MRSPSVVLIFSLLGSFSFAQSTSLIEWQNTLGGSLSEEAHSVQQTSDGGYIIAGYTRSTDGDVSSYHGGPRDCWLIRLDGSGNLLWEKTYGGSDLDEAYAVQQTSDGGYIVVGRTESDDGDVSGYHGNQDLWVFKLDPSGNMIWQNALGGSSGESARSVQQTTDGGYLIVGTTSSNDGDVSASNGGSDFWFVKLNSAGSLVWQITLGGTGHETAWSGQETTDGGYIAAGNTFSNDGDVGGNHGQSDFWVVKLDQIGNLDWQNTLGGTGSDGAHSIKQTLDGGYIVTGFSNSTDGDVTGNHGNLDYWVVKLDQIGNLDWQNSLGGTHIEHAYSVGQYPNGQYVISGYAGSKNGDVGAQHAQIEAWITILDSLGNLNWQGTLGGSLSDYGSDVHPTSDGGLIVAGRTYSVDGDVSGNHGGWGDIWVAKLNAFAVLQGTVFADLNGNNNQDPGEEGIGQSTITNLNTSEVSISNDQGQFFVAAHDIGITIIEPTVIPYYVPAPSTHTASFPSLEQQVDSLNDFAMQPNGTFNDLTITISPVGVFRPGFPGRYRIDYTNVGTTDLSPTVVFNPDHSLAFDSASVPASSITSDSVVWQLPTLPPFHSKQIDIHLTVDSNVSLGMIVTSSVRIEPVFGDAYVGNNNDTWSSFVQGSYDPNDILVDHDRILFQDLSPTPPDLTYLIRFQNTGTDTAFTVRIENDVPEHVDLSTFEFEASSHPVEINYLQHTDRMEYLFENILLPDSNVNEAASHGYIRYRIKPKSTPMIGDSVLNDARIYFDFNAPIETNTAYTVIETSTSIGEDTKREITITPNPSNGLVTVLLTDTRTGLITVHDATGRSVLQQSFDGTQETLDLRKEPTGVYLITVETDQGSFYEKVVIE